MTKFNSNSAFQSGGAVYSLLSSNIAVSGNSTVEFNNNSAKQWGGATIGLNKCSFLANENSSLVFKDNTGGSVHF